MEILMLIGKFAVWMIYLAITFITWEVFEQCKSMKNKLITLLLQIIVSTAMIIPFCLIESWESGLMSQIGMVSGFWLMIWGACYFQRKKIVKILKGQPTSKREASN